MDSSRSGGSDGPRISRRSFGSGAALAAGLALAGSQALPAAAHGRPGGTSPRFGSVTGSPGLPPGFKQTFKSRMVRANGLRQHVVVGGEGPPLLLVHGWPESWYAWRFVMPALARNFTVVAVDQRGIGLTDKPATGYDAATKATHHAELMRALGHERFAVAGHDTGLVLAYALAADHRDRVVALVGAEIPGPPGVSPDEPKYFAPDGLNNRLWHIAFNRVDDELIVDMVAAQAQPYYRYEFAVQGGGATLPDDVINYYVGLYTRSRDVLRASFGFYRAWDATQTQNGMRAETALTIPVLAVGGANSWGGYVAEGMRHTATDVHEVVLPSGHWVAEQAPDQLLAALTEFLAPYAAQSD
jgi:pimeloyl-ACP methyl ester carboxylesterase